MSLVFSDTTNYQGIIQELEAEIGEDYGFISDNPTRLKRATSSINQAFGPFWSLAINASGTWQVDDSNQTDYPIIRRNIVSGQREYPFTTDESGNLILDVHRVRLADSGGNYSDLKPRDLQSETAFDYFDTSTGVATEYDKTANAIILGSTPNYNYTNGLEVYINREASFFTTSDTTKKPGVPGIFHRWFVIRPAEDYARRNSLTNYAAIRGERISMEADIKEYFASRNRDERKRLTVGAHSNK